MSGFELLRSRLEKEVIALASLITNQYQLSCNLENATSCKQKLYDECVGVSINQICLNDYPKEDVCLWNGRLVPSKMGMRFPNDFDMSSLTNQQKAFICSMRRLRDNFLAVKNKFNDKISRIYFGTYFGFFAGFPAIQHKNIQGKCKDSYDPSERLWYLQSSTGPKNIVFVIDLSSSMTELQKTKQSIKKIINSLSFNDFVGVVGMKGTSKILIYNELNRATQPVKMALDNSISKLKIDPNSTTVNYQLAFDEVRVLFSRSNADLYGSSCEFSSNIVIFMTGSPPTAGLATSDALIAKIDEWNQSYKFKLFAYAFRNEEDFSVLRNLSCRYEGHFYSETNKTSTQSLEIDFRAYERFLAETVSIDTVTWTEPYNDKWTNERMVTVTFPAYIYFGDRRKKLGVVAIDVKTSLLELQKITEGQALKLLLTCPTKPSFVDQCVLQKIRYRQTEQFSCRIEGCTRYRQIQACQFNLSIKQMFAPPELYQNETQSQCCLVFTNPNYLSIITMALFLLCAIIAYVGLKIVQKCKPVDRNGGYQTTMTEEIQDNGQGSSQNITQPQQARSFRSLHQRRKHRKKR